MIVALKDNGRFDARRESPITCLTSALIIRVCARFAGIMCQNYNDYSAE